MVAWKTIVALTCLWLMACSPQDAQRAHFQTYLTRVAHVLEVSAPKLTPPSPLAALPAQRDLTLTIPRISTGLLDALKLGRCDLLGLVAEHNGPLGKSQSAAGQLAYHLQFQQGVMQCLSQTDDPELRAWLSELTEAKAPLLPRYFWNMMVAEPDIRAALSPAVRGLPFTAQPGFQDTLSAFQLFSRLQQHTHTPTERSPSDHSSTDHFLIWEAELSRALQGLYKNPYLGELFYSLHGSAHYLEQSNDFLAALDDIHCQGSHAIKGERLRNAMQHYYIKDIQAYLAQLDRQFVALAPLLETSLTPLEQESPPETAHTVALMTDYRQYVALGLNSELYVRYRTQTLAHAKRWQDFLKRCELSPKRG